MGENGEKGEDGKVDERRRQNPPAPPPPPNARDRQRVLVLIEEILPNTYAKYVPTHAN